MDKRMNFIKQEAHENTFQLIQVDVSHRCNMFCKNCFLPNRDYPDLDVDIFEEKFLSKLPNKKIPIRLIGGEPTLNPQLPEFIKRIKKYNHIPTLVTNGLRLATDHYMEELVDAGLRFVQLSMNGAANDSWYQALDAGNFAEKKLKAFDNLIKHKCYWNTGTIISKGYNDGVIKEQIKLVYDRMKHFGQDMSMNPWKRIKPIVRFRSIGAMGDYQEDGMTTLDEMIDMFEEQMGYRPKSISNQLRGNNYIVNTSKFTGSVWFEHETDIGSFYIRFTDWDNDDDGGFINTEAAGRMTEDFKVAPFYKHIIANENGY
jgi:molybdenum cofactor biosynthesis enzyme MoaA